MPLNCVNNSSVEACEHDSDTPYDEIVVDNYRPIALASVFSKMTEVIILARIEICLDTNPNQFGFKKKHGTDQCIYVSKEIIDL